MDKTCVEQVREILALWDENVLSAGEFESRIFDLFRVPFFECIESGETYMQFGSCCCSSHPPNRTFKVEITIQPHGFTATRCD